MCVILIIANSGNYLHLSTVIHYKQLKFICTALLTMQIIAKQLCIKLKTLQYIISGDYVKLMYIRQKCTVKIR